MTQKKNKPFDILENTFEPTFFIPILGIIQRTGYYWINSKTIDEIGQQYFYDLISLHNIKIVSFNRFLNLYKLSQYAN